jgi:hypothetical protein
MQDYFVLGVDKLTMTFQHGFGTSPMLDTDHGVKKKKNWKGKSTIQEENLSSGSKRIHTTVYKNCPQGVSFDDPENGFDKCKRVKEFKPGENIGFSIEEWLDLADSSLDDRAKKGSIDYVMKDSPFLPSRRSMGANLEVVITYDGRTDDSDDFYAAVTVSLKSESFSYKGHFVTHTLKRGLGYFDLNQEFVDSFARGVRFTFSSQGFIRRFDWFTAINYFITLVLLIMSVVPGLLKFAAFHWPGDLKAPVYEAATNEKFSFKGALASFSAQSAMAKQFLADFKTDAGGRISRTNYETERRKLFNPFSAAAITESIFAAVAARNHPRRRSRWWSLRWWCGCTTAVGVEGVEEEFVTKEDVVDIFTNDVFDMQALLKSYSFQKNLEQQALPCSVDAMNVEELRALAALEKVSVGNRADNLKVAPSRLSVEETARAKAAYEKALAPVLKAKNFKPPSNSNAPLSPNSSSVPAPSTNNGSPSSSLPLKNNVVIRVPPGATVSQLCRQKMRPKFE